MPHVDREVVRSFIAYIMAHINRTPVIRASVWIRPTGPALDVIKDAVRTAHKRTGGPHIKPHVTLLAGIESTLQSAEWKLKRLAMRMKPFTIELGEIEWQHDYFRCLYARVLPNETLEAAHRDAHAVFEMNPPDPYFPHLSLVYGDVDESLKRKLAAELGGKLSVSFHVTSIELVNAAVGVPIPDWRTLAERSLLHETSE